MEKGVLAGSHVLQVEEYVNIAAPVKERLEPRGAGAQRCLKLLLSDGACPVGLRGPRDLGGSDQRCPWRRQPLGRRDRAPANPGPPSRPCRGIQGGLADLTALF